MVKNSPKDKIFDFDLTYITSRGLWYHHSWKGDETKSGGLVTNIGIHFFDMLMWIFGDVRENIVFEKNKSAVSGLLKLDRANVNWFLSCDYNRLPQEVKEAGQRTFRNVSLNGKQIEFSKGFTDLHIKSYEEILKGNGFNIEDVKPSIELVYNIAKAKITEK